MAITTPTAIDYSSTIVYRRHCDNDGVLRLEMRFVKLDTHLIVAIIIL